LEQCQGNHKYERPQVYAPYRFARMFSKPPQIREQSFKRVDEEDITKETAA